VIAVIQQPGWTNKTRTIVAFAACLVAGAGTAYFEGDLTSKRFATAALTVLVMALTTYRSFWKTVGVAGWVESSTSPAPPAKTAVKKKV